MHIPSCCVIGSRVLAIIVWVTIAHPLAAQHTLRTKIGQMVMVTFTGDSLEKNSPSLDTLKTDLANNHLGGVIFFTWSGNLRSPDQIRHLTSGLQSLVASPLLIATDQEGGRVARLSASNGFASSQTAYAMGTTVNTESNTRTMAATMAGWFEDTGITMNLAPVVDVNVNPASPAIGYFDRSFSADPSAVTQHASWFIDEFRKKNVITTLKHFPGHGSAVGNSHLGFTDVTSTWTSAELQPFQDLITAGTADAVMTAHIFNAQFDSVHPATLSHATMTGLLRDQLGYDGVVVSDAMEMAAITSLYGFDDAAIRAVKAGVDVLLYTRNLTDSGGSLARHLVDRIESAVLAGDIPASRIDESYERIQKLKRTYLTHAPAIAGMSVPAGFSISSYPNPFNGETAIRVLLPEGGRTSVVVFDLLGRRIAELHDGLLSAGPTLFRWTPHTEPSGTYLVRVVGTLGVSTHRILYLR